MTNSFSLIYFPSITLLTFIQIPFERISITCITQPKHFRVVFVRLKWHILVNLELPRNGKSYSSMVVSVLLVYTMQLSWHLAHQRLVCGIVIETYESLRCLLIFLPYFIYLTCLCIQCLHLHITILQKRNNTFMYLLLFSIHDVDFLDSLHCKLDKRLQFIECMRY